LATQKHAPLLNEPTDEIIVNSIPTGSVVHKFKRAKKTKTENMNSMELYITSWLAQELMFGTEMHTKHRAIYLRLT